MVLKVRWGGGGEGSGIFGGVTAPKAGVVGLVVLSRGELGVHYCSGCIGDKKNQDRMYIKAASDIAAHKKSMEICHLIGVPIGAFHFHLCQG